MTALASGCPDENVLLRVAAGAGDEAELARVEAHVDGCESCRRVLAAAASEGDHEPPARAPASLQRGEKVGRYVVEELLGVGGMGVVYAAHDPTLDRRVALKLLRDAGAEAATRGSRLRREAQTMARLAHANVVPIFELGEWDGRLFFVMELVEGTTLDAWRRRAPSRAQVIVAFVEAGRGLDAAHQAGVVHRDFKPANVLIGRDGRARVTDFGLARPEAGRRESTGSDRPVPPSMDLTRTGALLGTLAYMAPEQLEGKGVDGRSDQFSWCVAFVEALTERRPFEGSNPGELSASIARGPYLGGVPRSLRRIFARALSVDPENRFPSMQALLKALESAQRRRTGWMVAAGAGLAVVAIAAVAIAMALRAEPAPAPAPELVVTSAEPAPADGVLDLAMGETRRLWIPGLTQVAVAEPDFADVRVAGANVLELKGIRAGETAMFVTSGKEARRWKLRVGAGPQANPPPQRLALGVGHSAILERKHLARVAVGDPEIADIKVIGIGGNQLLIVGQRLGSTTLLIWLVDGSREQIEIEVEAN